jgi:ribosomal protein L31E
VRRHFEGEDVVIDQSVNESIWKRGSERPPSKLTVEVEKDEDGRLIVRVPSEWRGGEPAPSMSTNTTQKAHTL